MSEISRKDYFIGLAFKAVLEKYFNQELQENPVIVVKIAINMGRLLEQELKKTEQAEVKS